MPIVVGKSVNFFQIKFTPKGLNQGVNLPRLRTLDVDERDKLSPYFLFFKKCLL